jgi:hypothetical protein
LGCVIIIFIDKVVRDQKSLETADLNISIYTASFGREAKIMAGEMEKEAVVYYFRNFSRMCALQTHSGAREYI